ncbi:MAG: hypothetical protein VB878_06660 [Pirellulaceae bacterium]
MKRIALAVAVVIGLSLTATSKAQAQGFHFSGGGIHVDLGNVHHGGHYGHQSHNRNYNNHFGTQYRFHNTTHLDWHPGQYYRHGRHFHYSPGHYDIHRTGHYHRAYGRH